MLFRSDKIILEFAEAVSFQVTDLPSVNVNGVTQLVFGQNAILKPVGGHYTPYSQDVSLSSKTQAQAQDWVDSMLKSTVWEITLGNNPAFKPGDTFQLSNLLDHAGNRSSSFSVNTSTDLYNRPTSVLIDVVSKDNVISANDLTQTTTVSVKLVGAKIGDVVKLYMDGTSVVNQIGKSMGNADPNVKVESITVTQADLNANSVTFQLSANDWGGDGLRNLNATIQRGNGSVVSSDMRNVFVSTTADHWSSTGKIIWFDTDNIVQETGTDVTSWDASVGGSVAKSFKSAYNSYPMLVRNSVNGHNQLYFNGAEYIYNYNTKTWTVNTSDTGSPTQRKGAFMYFNDPQNLFANYNRNIPDVVPTKESYTVIANGRKDNTLDGMLTSIGANGSSSSGYVNGDFKLVTGNVGLAVWGGNYFSAYQGQNRTNYPNYMVNMNPNNVMSYSWDFPYLKPGPLADLGYNPTKTTYGNGMVEPMNSANLGMQLLLSHVYDTTPYGNSNMGDVSLFSNAELIGHRNTDYKIVLGGGKPAGTLTYPSDTDPQYQAILSTQFLIGAMNQTNIAPNSISDIGQNVNYLWRGMIGDIIWSAKAIKGAALQEINMYQAVKFGTVGYLNEPKSRGNTYDLSKTADKINLLDDILLLNQTAD